MEILLILCCLFLLIYFLPALTAYRNNHPNTASIFVINLFLGWTFVGWVVALAWAVSSVNKTNNEAPSNA